MCFSSGGYVSADLRMDVKSNPIARFLFQRQWEDPAVIEVEFSNIVQINIKPASENNGVDIIRTHLYLEDEMFFGVKKIINYRGKIKNDVPGLHQRLLNGG